MARMVRSVQAVPLVRADLTRADDLAVRRQVRHAPFRDDALLARWEAAWEAIWHRSAVAFADPVEGVLTLKTVLGWPDGEKIGVDPLLDPVWTEALTAAWLHPAWRDVDPVTGQGRGDFMTDAAPGGALRAGFCQHACGVPVRQTAGEVPFWLEDLSSLPLPVPGCGWGDVQVLSLSGNRLVAAGGSGLLLTRDDHLAGELRRRRPYPPGPLACALGLSQLESLPGRLARRQALAERYRLLRGREWFQLPEEGGEGRVWEMFLLAMASAEGSSDLQQFLRKAGIHAASPLWFQPAPARSLSPLPGLQRFREHMLAVPLYAALSDSDHKRIINRINRWVGYRAKGMPSSVLEPLVG